VLAEPDEAGDAAFRDIKPEHRKFAVNARSTPSRIFGHIWKISSRISLVTGLLPTGLRTRERNRQYRWKPARCQRTTVSGDTTMSAVLHRDQERRRSTQKILSAVASLGREF
jgi:hypothetical protein